MFEQLPPEINQMIIDKKDNMELNQMRREFSVLVGTVIYSDLKELDISPYFYDRSDLLASLAKNYGVDLTKPQPDRYNKLEFIKDHPFFKPNDHHFSYGDTEKSILFGTLYVKKIKKTFWEIRYKTNHNASSEDDYIKETLRNLKKIEIQ